MNPEIFREYDIRGIGETEITDDVAMLIGKAYGSIVRRKGGKKVAVGRDNRNTSPRIAKSLMEGILSTGLDIVFIGESTTPQLYFAVHYMNTDGGINVTGSHNPPQYNGFKVLVGKDAIFGERIREIYDVAKKGKFETGKGNLLEKNIDGIYLTEIAKRVKVKRKVKVVADAGNGMGSDLGPKLLKMLGCEVTELFCKKMPDYPNHIPDPSQEKNVLDLKRAVVEKGAEFGVAFDGDCDRMGIVDENGKLLFGDQLLGIFAASELEKTPGAKIIFEVKCSQGLEEWVSKLGGKPIMWKTGHSLIKAKMKEQGAILAGEMSGHMFFARDWFGFDDALLGAAKFVEIASNSGMKISQMVEKMPKYYASPEYRVDFADSGKFGFVGKAKAHFSKKYKVIGIDGARILFGNGWALVRASNTQPKIIVRIEGKTKKDLSEITRKFLWEIKSFYPKGIELTE